MSDGWFICVCECVCVEGGGGRGVWLDGGVGGEVGGGTPLSL